MKHFSKWLDVEIDTKMEEYIQVFEKRMLTKRDNLKEKK